MNIQRLLYTVPLRLKSIFRNTQVEREMAEELRFHLEHKIAEGVATGLTPAQARLAALRAMDGLEQRKEQMRDARRIHWLTDFLDDTRYSLLIGDRSSAKANEIEVWTMDADQAGFDKFLEGAPA